ncbi:MAG TPA: TIGR04290 family methyltransferase [Polyangiaceae bacterium]|nr:TIGR04290 family methyltransferase [Polyangiaceae bacterium]
MAGTTMTREQIAARVRELGQWFHNMDLGGVETAPHHFLGDYPRIKWRRFEHVIPRDLRGKTVLDVGCNGGFYAIEMKRRGADRVLGIDTDEAYLAQARFAAQMSGVEIELRNLSVYEVGLLREKFDLVIFMGVFYHLRHPLLALDLLHRHVVRERLLFQSMLRGSPEVMEVERDYPFAEVGVFQSPAYPKMHFVEQSYAGDDTNWWIPNRACVEAMLRSSGFVVDEHPEEEVYVCRPREPPAAERRP